MASTRLALDLSATATSLTVVDDDALALFPSSQFDAWIGTEQVKVVSGPPGTAWTIVRDQSSGGGALFTDTFDRDEPVGWGNGWGRTGGTSTLLVSGGAGLLTPPIGGSKQPYQSSISVLDSEVRVRFSGDQLATDDVIHIHAVFRDNGTDVDSSLAGYYRALMSIRASDQLIRVRGQACIDGVVTSLGAAETTTGLTFATGTQYWLAARCSGVSPTTLEMKVWVEGTAEPAAWTRTDTDSTLGPQVAGYPGVRAGIGGSWSGGAFTASFDDYSVLRIPVGTAWAVGTMLQSIDEVDPASLNPVGDGAPLSYPPDGALYIDRLNRRLYVRSLAAWRYAALTIDQPLDAALTGTATLDAHLYNSSHALDAALTGTATLVATMD